MLKSLVELVGNVLSLLGGLFSVICKIFEFIAFLFDLVIKFVVSIPDFFFWLPTEITVLLVSIFSVVVVYKILGREG